MNIRSRWVLAAALALVAAHHGAAQLSQQKRQSLHEISPSVPPAGEMPQLSASDGEIAAFFDGYISRAVDRLGLPGGAVIVVRDGRIVLAEGYGLSNLASKQPVDVERSLFRAASISKVVPWVLAMQLVEEGRLNLDSDVNAYLDFEIPETFGRPVTMRHLMTHTAGFPERFHGAFDQDVSRPLGQVLRENIPQQVYAPGTTVAYSNYGAALAGYVVERLRGQPWEQVVAERFFKPLEMRHATVAQPVPEEMRDFLVPTYHYGSSTPVEFRTTPLAPMGSLTASPNDMGRILAALLNGGEGESGRVLTGPSIQRMVTLQKPLGPGLKDGLGLGFMVGEYRGVRYAGHAGNMTTLATDLQILPDQALGWYYLFNGQGMGEQARQVRQDLLFATIERFIASRPPSISAVPPSSAREVEGKYLSTRRIHSGPLMFSGLFNTTDAAAQANSSLVISSGGNTTRWLPAGRDRFVEEKTGIALAVTRGPDGNVQRIASALLYPVAEFERAPVLTFLAPPLAAFAFGTLFLALAAKPFVYAIRRRRRRRLPALQLAPAAGSPARADQVRRWARISYWVIIGTIVAWVAFAIVLAINFTLLFTMPGIVRLLLGIVTLLSAVFAAALLADAILSWRDGRRGLVSRLGASIVAAGGITAAALFYILDVVNFSADW